MFLIIFFVHVQKVTLLFLLLIQYLVVLSDCTYKGTETGRHDNGFSDI